MVRRRPGPAVWIGAVLLLAAQTVIAQPREETSVALAELVEVADIESLAASSDGRRVAFQVQRPSIETNGHASLWYVADIRSGRVARVASGEAINHNGALETDAPVWSPDSRFIFHRLLSDGAIGIWRSAADGSESRLVVGGEADVERIGPGRDGSELTYVTGPTRAQILEAETAEYESGILIDETVDPNQDLFRGGFVHGRLASQRLVGRWYQRDGLLWRAPRTRHRLDMRTLEELGAEPLPPPEVETLGAARGNGGPAATSERGDVASVSGADADRLEVRRRSGRTIVCTASQCRSGRIVALVWRPGRDQLLFTRQDRHFRQSLFLFDPASGRVRRVGGGQGQLAGGRQPHLPCAVTRDHAVCVAAGAVSPPRLERFELDGGGRVVLFDPNGALRAGDSPRVEHLEWSLADGRTATGTLLLPPGPAPRRAPLFVTYYYCPGFLRGGTGDEFPLAPMAQAGFVVACLNVVPFRQWGDGVDRYRAALASVEALVDLLGRRGLIDRSHIGMGGFSAGSEATMWVAVNSDLLAAAAIASPQYEPAAWWAGALRGRDNRRVMREFMQVGAPDEDRERWRLISPALNADRIRAPLLMQFPEQEIRSAAELHARLSNTTTPVEMYAFPDEGHVKMQPRHRLAVYRRNLDWFRYWLQDHVDTDPARAAQYRRWDELRRRRVGSTSE
ncbi:MAG: Atxe2 family lasso peptide isopeptidase [Sphingomonas sp.]|nr:Atxe2 family lasso peptide isopeptidase [Sphingomonas sp.]